MPNLSERLADCKLLIVEDDRINTAVLQQQLSEGGYRSVTFAENGRRGLELTQSIRPDLVILDMVMPEMDGFEYCRALKRSPELSKIPVIVQTSLEHSEDKIRAFAMGASDYITKPLNSLELLARIKVHLTNKLLFEETLAQQQQMHSELLAAQMMQKNLMPSIEQTQMAEEHYGLQIAKHFETSSMMGGDSWGMHPLSDTRLGIYMIDFSGHGISSALNMFRMHTLMQELFVHGNEAGSFLAVLNHHIYPLLQRQEFATMFYGILDTEANSLEYAAAATPPALVVRENGGHNEWLDTAGLPLGVTPDARYPSIYTPFAPGDILLMFSDCLIETANNKGEMINTQDIAVCASQALASGPRHKAVHIKNTLLAFFHRHNPKPIGDDLTVNVYCRKED